MRDETAGRRQAIGVGGAMEAQARRSLAKIARLLRIVRYAFLVMGAVFLLWEGAGAFVLGEGISFARIAEVVGISVMGPGLVWVSSRWGEKLAKTVGQMQEELIASNRTYQREVIERRQAEEALRESREWLETTLRSIGDAVVATDVEGRVTLMNPVAEALTGWRQGEAEGRALDEVLNLVEERSGRRAESPVPRIIREGIVVGLANHTALIGRDGTQRPIADSGAPIRDAEGTVVGTVLVFHDITAQRQAEEARRESEEQYRAVVQSVGDGISVVVGTKRVFMNQAFLKLYGFSGVDEAINTEFDEHILPEDRAQIRQRVLARQRGEPAPRVVEYRIRRLDGEVRTVQASSVGITYRSEPAALAVLRDVTELRQAEEALRESEAFHRALVDNMADPVTVTVGVKRVFVNRAFLELAGVGDVEEALKLPVGALVAPEDREEAERYLAARQRGEPKPSPPDIRLRRPDGTVRTIRSDAVSITYRGEPAVLSVIHDVTEHQRLEEERIEHTRELEGALQELQTTQQRLIQASKLTALGELVSGVAHEVNNPLTNVLGYLELLLRRDLGDEVKGDLETARQEAERAVGIVQNLLSFARQHPPAKSAISINEVLESVVRLRAYELRVNNIEVAMELQADLPNIMADFHQLQQVFLNIIINAEQAMGRKGGRLVVTSRQGEAGVMVSIGDSGPGIPKEHLSKLFDPFFTTKRPGNGTGLGLSICYGIVREHGGEIRVESREGEGATFSVELPVNGDQADRRRNGEQGKAAEEPVSSIRK